MAEETRQAEAGAAAAPPGKSKVLLLVIVAVVLAGGGAGAWFAGVIPHASKGEAKTEQAKEERTPEVGAILPLDPFIANLGDEDGKRYLKATLQVEFFDRRVPDDFHDRSAQMRDLLVTLFTSKTFNEVRTPEGKEVLREEIINRMNRTLHKDLVKAVYFTEFIVQ